MARSVMLWLYSFDYQGNVVGVYNTKTGSLEQTTDYYPYGLPHATATYLSDRNRRLYSAKELTTEAGLNAYDFAARWLSPAFPRFSSPDPLADQYTPIGTHVFCGGDPVNLIDPSGLSPIYDKNGHFSYKSVINFKRLWNYTTNDYKENVLEKLIYYTINERDGIDLTKFLP